MKTAAARAGRQRFCGTLCAQSADDRGQFLRCFIVEFIAYCARFIRRKWSYSGLHIFWRRAQLSPTFGSSEDGWHEEAAFTAAPIM